MKPPRSTADWQTFIRDNTKLLSPPLVPEIKLHLAEESLPIWQKTEEELGEMNIPPPYWAFAWAGGQALARYLLDNPAITRGQKVLDLGSGSGLTAIAARMAGAQSALATDIDEVALIAAGMNAAANGMAVEVTAEDLLDAGPGDANVILAGDLFYERDLAMRMLTFLDVCTTAGATVLVGDPQRSYFPKDRFESVAEYRVPVTRELEDTEIKNAAVWRLRR
ncbi:MAG TPA: 50S ribosomal protein L11 methyltransferase [Hyphomicrobiaceae bacterium]